MATMKILKEVQNFELLRKYVPNYDGILFQIGGNSGRGICSDCGTIWPLKDSFVGSICPNCGKHNFLNVTQEIPELCWSSDTSLDGKFGEHFDTVLDTPTSKQLVRKTLMLTLEKRNKISFSESSSVVLEMNNKGILSTSYPQITSKDVKALGDFEFELEVCATLDYVFNGHINLETFNEYHKAMSNPDFPKLFREYTALFNSMSDDLKSSFVKFHSLHDICVELGIPMDMEPYWILYTRNYYGSSYSRETIVGAIKKWGEVGERILRLVVREIVGAHELVTFFNAIQKIDSLNKRKTVACDSFFHPHENVLETLSESMRNYAITFMVDNFQVYKTRVFSEFLSRCAFLSEKGILPTEDNLSTKEYYCLVNKLSGLKPDFCDMVLEDPLAALKLL